MKTTHYTLHTTQRAISFVLVLAVCIFFSPGCLADALEPNDSLAEATLVDGVCTYSGLQVSAGDSDFFILMPLSEGRISISLDFGSESTPVDITIHNGEIVNGNVVIVDSETDEGVSGVYSKSFDILSGQLRAVEVSSSETIAQSYSFVSTLADFSLVYTPDYRIVPSQMPSVLTAGQPCDFDLLVEERPHPYALWAPSTLSVIYYQFWQSEDLVGEGRSLTQETGAISLASGIGGLSVVPYLSGTLGFRFYEVDPESSPGVRPVGHAGPISILPSVPAAIDVTNLDGDTYHLRPWLPGAGLSDIGRLDADGKAAYDIEVQVVDDFGNAVALGVGDVFNLDLAVDQVFAGDVGLEVELYDFAFVESVVGSNEILEEDDDANGIPMSYTSFPLASIPVSTTVTRARGRLLLQSVSLMPHLTNGSFTQTLYFQGMVNGVPLQAQAVNGGAVAAQAFQPPGIKFTRGEVISGSALKHQRRHFNAANGGVAAGFNSWTTLSKINSVYSDLLYNASTDDSYTSTPNSQSLGPGTYGRLYAKSSGSYAKKTLDPDNKNDSHRSAIGLIYRALDDRPLAQPGEIKLTKCNGYLEGRVFFKSAGDANLYVENSIDDGVAAASWTLQADGLHGSNGKWNISAQYDGNALDNLFELLVDSIDVAMPAGKFGKAVASVKIPVLDAAPELATGPDDLSNWNQDFSRSWTLEFQMAEAGFFVESAYQAQVIIDKTSMSSGMTWAFPSARVSWQAHLVCLDSRGKKGATAVGNQKTIDAMAKYSYVIGGAVIKYPGVTAEKKELKIDWIGE